MPNNKYSTISVRLTEDERKILDDYCKQNDLSLSWVIRKAIKEYLPKEDK